MADNTPVAATQGVRGRLAEQGAPKPERNIAQVVREMAPQFAMALAGSSIAPEKFVRIALTEFRKTPDLLLCSKESLLGALLTAAQLGLEFGQQLGHAYLVPYKQTCQLIVGYRGYIDLARRSGEIKDIKAVEVYEGDEWEYWSDEQGDHFRHVPWAAIPPARRGDRPRGDIWLYYGRVVYTNGGSMIHVMTLQDIEERRLRSATADSRRSPWKSDRRAMSRKTVIRAMVPYLPLTTEVAESLNAADEAVLRYRPGQSATERPEGSFIDVPEVGSGSGPTEPTPTAADADEAERQAFIDADATEAGGAPVDPSEPLPEPPEGDDATGPFGTVAPPQGGYPPELVESTQRAVDSWDDPTVNRVISEHRLGITGAMKAKRVKLFQVLVERRYGETDAIEALF